jgi:ribonuclease P protein component
MFKKTNRITTKEFNQYFKAGARHHHKHLTVITHPHPTLKVAVVAGKKVAKSAVARNRLKRRVLAQLKTNLTERTGVYIVILKPTFAGLARKSAMKVVGAAVAGLVKNQ